MARFNKTDRKLWAHRHLRIDSRIWADPMFQVLWSQRWDAPCKMLLTSPYPFTGWPNERSRDAFWERNRFDRNKKRLLQLAMVRLGAACIICGSLGPLFPDHVIPLCWGGCNHEVNIQPLCMSCNSRKGGRLPTPPLSEIANA